MKILQENVLLRIQEAAHLWEKESIILTYSPISETKYKQLAATRIPSRRTNPHTRILLKSMKIDDVNTISNLTGKTVTGDIVEFLRKDNSTFVGVNVLSINPVESKIVVENKKELPAAIPGKKSMVDVAAAILERENKPLQYKYISELMLKEKSFFSKGKTPEATLSSNIGIEIRTKGQKSRFVKICKGVYGLNPILYPNFGLVLETDVEQPPAPIVTEVLNKKQSNTFFGSLKDFVLSKFLTNYGY